MTNLPSRLHSEGRLILVCVCVCSDGWTTWLLTPHRLCWREKWGRAAPTCTSVTSCPAWSQHTHTLGLSTSHFPAFFWKKNQISCQKFDVAHIFCQLWCHFTPSFPSPPPSCHVAFRQMRMRSFWISIIYYNCPLRKARGDSPTIHLCVVSTRFSCAACTLSPQGFLRKDANVLDWVWWWIWSASQCFMMADHSVYWPSPPTLSPAVPSYLTLWVLQLFFLSGLGGLVEPDGCGLQFFFSVPLCLFLRL